MNWTLLAVRLPVTTFLVHMQPELMLVDLRQLQEVTTSLAPVLFPVALVHRALLSRVVELLLSVEVVLLLEHRQLQVDLKFPLVRMLSPDLLWAVEVMDRPLVLQVVDHKLLAVEAMDRPLVLRVVVHRLQVDLWLQDHILSQAR